MSLTVFFAVLLAALLHASWNAAVKGGPDKLLAMSSVILGHVPFALASLLIAPAPEPASYPYLAAGVALHLGYQLFLVKSYALGDLTQVYPIARGSAPLIVAVVSVGFLGVALSIGEVVAVLLIACGILSLALVRKADGQRNGRAAALALTTGCFIAGYSLVDGLGARAAGTSLGFFAWLAVFNGGLMAIFLALRSPETLRAVPKAGRGLFIVGGGASFIAFAIVTWGFTQAPIALVAALRETSIIFALLIGVVFLKEPLNLLKVASTMLTICGAVLLRAARQ
ncbi:MAG: DMT family transporter [Paracoccaceae bacterium]|nr:DMT family transporter [Paracoccaceae bacterium]